MNSLCPGLRANLHRPTGSPSPEGAIPERIAGVSPEIRCRVRRAASGLTPPLLASLRDASPGAHDPVVSLVPRSTTGYKLRSLRLPPSPHAEGMATCSRWLSVATPPEPEHHENRTPAGVPAIQTHTLPPNSTCLEELDEERTTLPECTEHQTQEAESFPACSRWSSEATPPEPISLSGIEADAVRQEAEGFPACSRWLSAATPPEPEHHENRTPAGVPARNAAHAIHPHQPALPPDFCHQEPRAPARTGVAWPTPRIPRRNSAGARRPSQRCGRCGRPCSSSRFAQGRPLPRRFHAGIKESRFRLDSGNPSAAGFPLAGRLCRLHGQRLRPGFRSGLHRPTRGPSPEGTIPERIAGDSQKIRCRIRRAVSGLTPPLLASLRDASPGTHGPVVSLVPRSTTGYKLRSLRLPGSRQQQPRLSVATPSKPEHHKPGSHRLLRRHHAEGMAACGGWLGGERTTLPEPTEHQTQEANGFPACSRWLSAATPPEPVRQENRTPAGVPAIQVHTTLGMERPEKEKRGGK